MRKKSCVNYRRLWRCDLLCRRIVSRLLSSNALLTPISLEYLFVHSISLAMFSDRVEAVGLSAQRFLYLLYFIM